MTAGATYFPIATTTLGSATGTVTFSSIASTYTDLIVVYATSASADTVNYLRFNGDSGSNYSYTLLYGDGTTAGSSRASNTTNIQDPFTMSSAITSNIIQIMNYSNSTTYKTALIRSGAANNSTVASVGLWRNTAAITSVSLVTASGTFNTGSTFTIYGIAAA